MLSGAWASGWVPGPCGPGGVLSVVLVTTCVVVAAVGLAVAAGRCAPRRVRASVGSCGSDVAGWGVVLRPCARAGAEAVLLAG